MNGHSSEGAAVDVGPGGSFPPGSLDRPGLVTLLAVLEALAGLLFLIAAVVTVALVSGNDDQRTVGLIAGFVMGVLGALDLLCAYGLWKLAPFGRIMLMVFACLRLLAFPVGTLIAVLVLIYMTRPGIKALFSGKTLAQMSPAELQAIAALRGGASTGAIVAIVIVGFFVVVAVIGIIAAIAIPNLLTAVQRAKQKRTSTDMRSLMSAIESYAADSGNRYPEATTMAGLAPLLEPEYIAQTPRADAWMNEFRYWSDGSTYVLVSAGKDGLWEQEDPSAYEPAQTTHFDADLVASMGEFVRAPSLSWERPGPPQTPPAERAP